MNHIESHDCWCNPKVELYDGGNVIVHHDVLLVRKKPVEVTAKLWDNKESTYEELCLWMTPVPIWCGDYLKVETLEGDMLAKNGDYIIRGVNGEFYPCKPDIFSKTYDIV